MTLTDLPVLNALKLKMQWLQARQRVLAENVANADTPGYQPKELRRPAFGELVRRVSPDPVQLAQTDTRHLSGRPISGSVAGFGIREGHGWETTPSGNGVVLEEAMMKVTANQMDYQAASSLYARSIAMLKIAVGGTD